MNINDFGFIRVGAATPLVKVADCNYNISEIKKVIEQALQNDVQILCFPELSITSYTCGDLFFQEELQKKAISSLIELSEFVKKIKNIVVIVGLPYRIKNSLYNMAAVISGEGIIGMIPKTYLANNYEYQEKRWFTSKYELWENSVKIDGNQVPVSRGNTIFYTPFGNFGVEICEDLWMSIPPSSEPEMQDADIIFNLSASNELVGKNRYRKSLIIQQSARSNCAYIYSSAGVGESTTDIVFSGTCLIADNGKILAESKRFSLENELIIADIDISSIRHDKLVNTNYHSVNSEFIKEVYCNISPITSNGLFRNINLHPFIPGEENRDDELSEVFNIQTHGLIKRLKHIRIDKAVIGISGGLDSTLALLVTVKAFEILGIPLKNIHGITMPGLGTTERTKTNAKALMNSLGITNKEISIVNAVTQHFLDIDQDINKHDITFENSQARERTQILMDYANMINGLVVGTGNMSELALGWATYNGDHMSMYAVNSGVPKTLVATLTRWIAETQLREDSKNIILDILDTPFSPELLPADSQGKIAQKTEHVVGPYELHDFFMHRMLRYGEKPNRILFIANYAFKEKYSFEEILKWLKIFYKRFFSQQFKRSALPDGPKVGSINLSPRGTWRMPSDAEVNTWLEELDKIHSSN
jgi:NAD+ synthase (glutamine-hydrolysing)